MTIGGSTPAGNGMFVSARDLPSRLREDFEDTIHDAVKRVLGPASEEIDVEALIEEKSLELRKTQRSSEEFEAAMIKRLIATMRKSMTQSGDKGFTEFAYDTMDQAIADSTARSEASFGIAKSVFASTAEQLVRNHLLTQRLNETSNEENHG